jgi:2-amino-4-hydroxy-6-hydroxymethyldihydropteridine diphosphokinase
MAWVTLSLGSNIDATNQITSCLDALLLQFNDLSLSSVFKSEAVGFEGDNFLNMVVGIETEVGIPELSKLLKVIEDKHGRDRNQPKFSGRYLDIDILTYNSLAGEYDGINLPRAEITENAFVLWPLTQIDGKGKHPVLRQTYTELWSEYDKEKQKLWPVDFEWHGRIISSRH